MVSSASWIWLVRLALSLLVSAGGVASVPLHEPTRPLVPHHEYERPTRSLVPHHEYERPPSELHATGVQGSVGRVEAESFGIVADGQHDDTEALQRAIDAVSAVAWRCQSLLRPSSSPLNSS